MTEKKTTVLNNYSGSVKKLLAKISVKPGQRLKISNIRDHWELEGYLLPKTEFTSNNVILIKLDNGYNIGIDVTDELVVQKTSGEISLETFPQRLPRQKKGLPEISLLGTGGTIASRIDYVTGGVVMALDPEEIFSLFRNYSLRFLFEMLKACIN